MGRLSARILAATLLVAIVFVAAPGRAGPHGVLEQALVDLLSDSGDKAEEIAGKLADLADPNALPALEALCDERLRKGPDGTLYIEGQDRQTITYAVTGEKATPSADALGKVEMSNALRRAVLPVLAQLRLGSPDRQVRLAAAEELAKRGSNAVAPLLRNAHDHEKDAGVRKALALALAQLDLYSENRERRLQALGVLGELGGAEMESELVRLTSRGDDGRPLEADEQVRTAAAATLRAIEDRARVVGILRDVTHGISLASVLLFAALGLAVTFGLMGVINMAHGEMLMVGAYVTYSVEVFFDQRLPSFSHWYLAAAIPIAFAVTTLLGILLERLVIRHLYGRQLETLLATWGISLMLMQSVRLLYGAQNVAVSNPPWLSGGVELAHGWVLTYNRLAVVAFVVVVATAVWSVLRYTTLGIKVRAVAQNRAMAACLGVPTARLDAWVFGLGSGVAGLGGVALSQLGNVGPELGQTYIIDAFMVVVLGGVGKLAGTVSAAVGLGIINKLVEPFAGAVLGKIAILLLIIVFIQRRPEGLFASKGRVEA
ncbi:MAG TPA: urea ABC transporter permease subunit UrtB [Polyangiaceae bacterium]|nr:urea ABC transporter permease subunit UrtB [Polyangiaceae bacterium]